MGIRDGPISPSSPWQNGIAERLIGTLRRECLDQMLVFGEAHLRRILSGYATNYNQARTHMALQKGQFSETEPLAPYPFWRVFIVDTRGYDFRKGQIVRWNKPLIADDPPARQTATRSLLAAICVTKRSADACASATGIRNCEHLNLRLVRFVRSHYYRQFRPSRVDCALATAGPWRPAL